MNEEISRLSRLTAIIIQLQSKRIITASEIARKFNISKRTVYRDIRTLEGAGVPIAVKERKGYSLMDGYNLPPIMFTEEEANTLITLEKLVSRNEDTTLIEAYSNVIAKIKAVLNDSEKDKAEILSSRIGFSNSQKEIKKSNTLSQVQFAITNQKLLEMSYRSNTGEETTRTVEAYGIYLANENWVLIAWCRLRNDFREFRLNRVLSLKIRSDAFRGRNFNLTEYFLAISEKFSVHR